MGIKLIYLLRGTAARLVLLPAQNCCEKCSPFPSSCTSMQGSHFVLCIYLAMFHIESSLEKHQSTLTIKIMKNYVMRAYQACSGMYQRSCGWESHALSSPYDLSARCINRLPSRWWCYFNYSALRSLGSSQAAQDNDGKRCFRISQLLELHLQVISCSILIFLLAKINVTERDILNWTFLQLSWWKLWWMEEGPLLTSRKKYFFEASLFQKFQSATSCSPALVW